MDKDKWDETMEYLEILSQIQLTPEEKKKTAEELRQILKYMEKLETLNTDQAEPMSHVYPIKNIFREDIITNTEDKEEMLKNAPQKKEGQYMVPKTV